MVATALWLATGVRLAVAACRGIIELPAKQAIVKRKVRKRFILVLVVVPVM